MLIKNSAIKLLVTLCIILNLHAMEKDPSSITEMHTTIGSSLFTKKDYHDYQLIRTLQEGIIITIKRLNPKLNIDHVQLSRNYSKLRFREEICMRSFTQGMSVHLRFGSSNYSTIMILDASISTRFGDWQLIGREHQIKYKGEGIINKDPIPSFIGLLKHLYNIEFRMNCHISKRNQWYNIVKIKDEPIAKPKCEPGAEEEPYEIRRARWKAMTEKYNKELSS